MSHTLNFIYYGRMQEKVNNKYLKKWYGLWKRKIGNKYGMEITSFEKIGRGLLLCHAYNITVNENAVLGNDVTLFKGSTIGSIRTGKRKGVPCIGDRVVVGINATVVGGVSIGNDVMIAPGAYVNFDVPSNSVVIGNPGCIYSKMNAADDYYTAFADKKRLDEEIEKCLKKRN